MPILLFMQIGSAAVVWGLLNTIIAAVEQKEAKRINEKANELLKNISAEREVYRRDIAVDPLLLTLKDKALTGVKTGVLAALGTCGMAMSLAATGKIIAAVTDNGRAARFTILTVLGNGSLTAGMAVLAGITVSVAGAVLGVCAREKASENVKKAYADLFEVKRIRREIRSAQPGI